VKALVLLEDPAGPSARLRFEPFARRLEVRGHAFERVALPRSGPRRWRTLAGARAFDAVFLQRRLLQPWESALLASRARRLVVDVDDAIWRRDHPPFESFTRRRRALALLRRADVVLAGSRTLVEELARIGIAATLLPTPAPPAARLGMDGSPAGLDQRGAHRAETLLWIGQPSTWRYARDFAPAWRRIRRERPRVRLLAVGSGLDHDPLLPFVEQRVWSEAAEARALAESDVGLAPLPDDPWTRGKCGARLLAYLSAGLPAVASPVGAQRELADEIDGVLLAADPESFAERTLELLADPGRGRELARDAACLLAARRSPDLLAGGFLDCLTGAEGSGQAPAVAGSRAGG
jgi:glycosyltransferase involved in cell wall biosynthesis